MGSAARGTWVRARGAGDRPGAGGAGCVTAVPSVRPALNVLLAPSAPQELLGQGCALRTGPSGLRGVLVGVVRDSRLRASPWVFKAMP